jgi:hypothetical protein
MAVMGYMEAVYTVLMGVVFTVYTAAWDYMDFLGYMVVYTAV